MSPVHSYFDLNHDVLPVSDIYNQDIFSMFIRECFVQASPDGGIGITYGVSA